MITLEEIEAKVPQSVRDAVRTHGFAKLAAAMYSVPEISLGSAANLIGTKLAMRRAEWREISKGLVALDALTR